MSHFEVSSGWYDTYWCSDQPRPKRRSFIGAHVRFAVPILLLVGSGVALSHVQRDASGKSVQRVMYPASGS
jgi:hypothetical protein